MTEHDGRWQDAEICVDSAVRHFGNAVHMHDRLMSLSRERDGDEDFYQAEMAYMHSVLCGHSSFESAMTEILGIFGEDVPEGFGSGAGLAEKASLPTEVRPAVIGEGIAWAVQETGEFRDFAERGYDSFTRERCGNSASAAAFLADGLRDEVRFFREAAERILEDDDPGPG